MHSRPKILGTIPYPNGCLNDNIIEVALIPHTLEHTNLSNKDIGDSVNIETDIIGKYIYQFISENKDYEDINSILIKTLNNLGLS